MFVARFDRSFFDKNAREMSLRLLHDIANGQTLYFHGPRGDVALSPADLAGVAAEARLDKARTVLLAARAHAGGVDGKRVAVLLARAMMHAANADGKLAAEEMKLVEAFFFTVPALRGHDARCCRRRRKMARRSRSSPSCHPCCAAPPSCSRPSCSRVRATARSPATWAT